MLEAIRILMPYLVVAGLVTFSGLSVIYLARIAATLTAMAEKEVTTNVVHNSPRHPVA